MCRESDGTAAAVDVSAHDEVTAMAAAATSERDVATGSAVGRRGALHAGSGTRAPMTSAVQPVATHSELPVER